MLRYILAALLFILVLAAPFLVADLTAPEFPEPTFSSTPEMKTTMQLIFKPTEEFATQTPIETATPFHQILVVRVTSVNVHTRPELSAPVSGWLYQNDQVIPELCDSGWVKIVNNGYAWGGCFTRNPCGEAENCK